MKMKYFWDEWIGEGDLPENLHCVILRNGEVTFAAEYTDAGYLWDTSINGSDWNIVSYCVAIPDLYKVCSFNGATWSYGEGDVILNAEDGKFYMKDCVRMSEHGDWFISDYSNPIPNELVEDL